MMKADWPGPMQIPTLPSSARGTWRRACALPKDTWSWQGRPWEGVPREEEGACGGGREEGVFDFTKQTSQNRGDPGIWPKRATVPTNHFLEDSP